MKVATKHAGKKVACPKCNAHLVVPGSPQPAAPVVTPIPAQPIPAQPIPAQPIPAQPIPAQPIPAQPAATRPVVQPAPQPLPDFFSTPAGQSPAGLQPYTPPTARSRAGKAKTPTSKLGLLVVLIGICIISGGLLFSGFGQATMHILFFRQTLTADPPTSRDEFEQRIKRTQSLVTMMEVSIKIGRTVLVAGTITAIVGYGICIASPGPQMALAIAAMIVGAIMAVLDLIMRVVPYLAENSIPHDFIMFRSSFLGRSTIEVLIAPLLEILMATHLLLFAIFATLGFQRLKKANVAVPATSIVLFAVYLGLVVVIAIIINTRSEPGGRGLLYTIIAMQWVGNICTGVGLGFLIASIVKLRT